MVVAIVLGHLTVLAGLHHILGLPLLLGVLEVFPELGQQLLEL